jgi:hypothetical protein
VTVWDFDLLDVAGDAVPFRVTVGPVSYIEPGVSVLPSLHFTALRGDYASGYFDAFKLECPRFRARGARVPAVVDAGCVALL